MDLQSWNDRYRAEGERTADATPLLVETAGRLTPGTALDLACGTGRNAIWLADRGWRVTAVDGSAEAIERLRRQRPSIDARLADLEKHEFDPGESAWDLIAICYYLQRDLFEPVKKAVRPGGVVIAIVHLVEPGHEGSRFSLQPGELASYFEGWRILHSREGKPNDPEHRRAVAEIVAERPRLAENGSSADSGSSRYSESS